MNKFGLIFPILLMFFQITQDINLSPLTNLIGSLGSAGAAVIVTIYFLSFIRDQNKIIDNIKENQNRMQESYRDHLNEISDKFLNRQKELQSFFQDQLKILADSHTQILHDTVIAVKTLENTVSHVRNDIQLVLVRVRPKNIEEEEEVKISKAIEEKSILRDKND